jgi:DNA-binding transcriptional ArsR family regulator
MSDESGGTPTTDRHEPREHLLVLDVDQARLLADRTRKDIVVLLTERPATTQQIAAAMGRPKGSIGYHLKILEGAGIIEVVRTRKVRAMTEKYYARVARTYVFPHMTDEKGTTNYIVEALEEMRPAAEDEHAFMTLRHARIDEDHAAEFAEELLAIAERFALGPRSGSTVHGLLIGLYPTDRPSLGGDAETEDREEER